jgi:hypothetical protein
MSESPRVTSWLIHPRVTESGGRLVIRYAGAVALVWIALAGAGLGLGFATAGSGDNPEAAYAGLGLGVIATFVAWFAVRPAIVADRSGCALAPLFGTRSAYRWDEVRAVGVRRVRGARGRSPALVVDASDDREAKIDGLWVGATRGGLVQMAEQLEAFVGTLDIVAPRFVIEAVDCDELDDHPA